MMNKEAYIKSKGQLCPFCGKPSVEGGFVVVDAGKAFQQMSCRMCQNKWQDVYHLVDIEIEG